MPNNPSEWFRLEEELELELKAKLKYPTPYVGKSAREKPSYEKSTK
jgi:hypothetical protein